MDVCVFLLLEGRIWLETNSLGSQRISFYLKLLNELFTGLLKKNIEQRYIVYTSDLWDFKILIK